MEDTLRVLLNFVMMKVLRCLNPCSNGRYAQRYTTLSVPQSTLSLNPCSNGRYSQSGWNIVDEFGVTS